MALASVRRTRSVLWPRPRRRRPPGLPRFLWGQLQRQDRFLSLQATATRYQIDAHPTSLLVVQYGRLCALCLHEATSWIPPTAAGKAPNLSYFVVFTHAILLILILCLFACSIGYIHDGRQAGAEQASPHNNIVMFCLFNAGKKDSGRFRYLETYFLFGLKLDYFSYTTTMPNHASDCQVVYQVTQ